MKKFYQLFLSLMVFALGVVSLSSCEKEKPTDLFLNNTALTMEVGATAQLVETVMPMGVEYEITWLTNQASVAEVSDKGLVTAKGVGEAEITAIVADLRKTCKVTVKEAEKEIKITLDSESKKINEGAEFEIKATVTPADRFAELQWKSSDETVATVNNGKVSAIKAGNATITAFIGEVKAECKVEVVGKDAVIVELSQKAKNMYVGDEFTLTATVTPVGKAGELLWKSSDEKVATVNNGVVKALAAGVVEITAAVGDVKDVCTVTVKDPSAGLSITLNHESYEGHVNGAVQLYAVVDPSDREDDLVWSSDNTTVATVDESGLVKFKSVGNAKISAKIDNVEAVCNITVKEVGSGSKFELNAETYPNGELTIEEDASHMLDFTIEPSDLSSSIVWTSSDESIAYMGGNRLYAKKIGQAVITGTVAEMNVTLTVNVVAAPVSISMDRTYATIVIDGTIKLIPTIKPTSAQDKKVEWSSDNEAVATVDADGLVTGKAAGVAVIKAEVEGATAECRVTVSDGTVGEIKDSWELYEVFDVPGYGRGLVINVTYSTITVMAFDYGRDLQWAKDISVVVGNNMDKKAYDAKDGIELTNKIGEKAKTYPGQFPAYEWAKSLGDQWYLPSPKELYNYFDGFGRKKINPILEELGEEPLPDMIWSSAETNRTPYSDAAYLENFNGSWIVSEHTKNLTRDCVALIKIQYK